MRTVMGIGWLIASVAAVLLSLGCVAGSSNRSRRSYRAGARVAQPQLTAPEQWVPVRPPDTGLAVSMPAEPRFEVETGFEFDGTPSSTTTGSLMASGVALFGLAVRYQRGGLVLDPTRDDSDEAADPDIVERSQRRFRSSQGFPTIDLVTERRRDGAVVYTRVSIGRTRTYTAFVALPIARERELHWVADAYLRSMSISATEAPSPAGDGRLSSDSWRFIAPPEASFAVEMPGDARYRSAQVTVGDEQVDRLAYDVRGGRGRYAFSVEVTQYGERPPASEFERARARWSRGARRITNERDIQIDGFPGRELRVDTPRGNVLVRTYLTRGRLYNVYVRTPASASRRAVEARSRFFRSFRIL